MGEQRDIASLADSGLPPRVREVATRLLRLSEAELGDRIRIMLEHLENQLYKQAERSRTPEQQVAMLKSVQTVKSQRGKFVDAYFQALQSRLALLRRGAARKAAAGGMLLPSSQWMLSDALPEQEAAAVQLRDLATPLESAASLSLYLLGQRFGVLAGAPAYGSEQICVAPRALLEIAGNISATLFGERVPVAMLQSHFAQQVLGDYAGFAERLNLALDEAGVLPGLTYVPTRPTKASQRGTAVTPEPSPAQAVPAPAEATAAISAASAQATVASSAASTTQANTPRAAHAATPGVDPGRWLEQPALPSALAAPQAVDFRHLQQLLTAHRIAGKLPPRTAIAPGQEIERGDIDRFLHELQKLPAADSSHTRSVHGLRETVLQRARQERGPLAELGREDADTFEILSLVYGEVAREVRAGSSVHGLLERLQLPILRLALQDRAFFDQPAHPARQLLNTIAESDASAYGEHAADPYFEAAMHKAVERMEDDFHGQPDVLDAVNEELQSQFRQQIKRSQANEKRLVEAARGRERMALAKARATDALQALMAENKPPRTIEVLLRRAWLDAMTLAALRHDEASPAWQRQLDTTRRILEIVGAPEPLQSPELADEIETAMRRVGYHDNEAGVLARQLSRSANAPRDDAEPTATELSARIRAHARLGEGEEDETRTAKALRASLSARSAHEEECYQHLRTLPFGCWLDFVTNQQGECERRRLSWYSTVTDKALFVNRRGQRVAELHMDALARLMARNQLRIVDRQQLRLIDRAFRSTLELLRNTLRGPATPAFLSQAP